jgi:hypothetical protein
MRCDEREEGAMRITFDLYLSDNGARRVRDALMDAADRAEERAQSEPYPEDALLLQLCGDLDLIAGHIARAIDEAKEAA